ncbi:MAG: glycosyltransferase family 1 protein [Ghiorsea sp.]
MAHILIDGREFVSGRRTGIGRFLEGLLLALSDVHEDWKLTVAIDENGALPGSLLGKVELLMLPKFPELAWPKLTIGKDLFFSPYPKLPILEIACPSIHTIHDIFYITHHAYKKNKIRTFLASWLIARSVKKASLTWFVSQSSHDDYVSHFGSLSNDIVRYSPVEDFFKPNTGAVENTDENFFLYVGNGLPHKNVDILFEAMQGTNMRLKCVGINKLRQDELQMKYPHSRKNVFFLNDVDDASLLELYRHTLALLLPSFEEGYGFPPLEAFACARPAIVSDIAVLKESTGGQAIYCSPFKVSAWKEEMSALSVEKSRALGLRLKTWIAPRKGLSGWREHLTDIERLVAK